MQILTKGEYIRYLSKRFDELLCDIQKIDVDNLHINKPNDWREIENNSIILRELGFPLPSMYRDTSYSFFVDDVSDVSVYVYKKMDKKYFCVTLCNMCVDNMEKDYYFFVFKDIFDRHNAHRIYYKLYNDTFLFYLYIKHNVLEKIMGIYERAKKADS